MYPHRWGNTAYGLINSAGIHFFPKDPAIINTFSYSFLRSMRKSGAAFQPHRFRCSFFRKLVLLDIARWNRYRPDLLLIILHLSNKWGAVQLFSQLPHQRQESVPDCRRYILYRHLWTDRNPAFQLNNLPEPHILHGASSPP